MPTSKVKHSRWTIHFLCNALQLIDHNDGFKLSVCVKTGLILHHKSKATLWQSINDSCSVTVRADFRLPAIALTGSAAQMERCWEYERESTHEKKRVCAPCVEDQQSPAVRKVINICMTGRMTAYFHGNMLVRGVRQWWLVWLCRHVQYISVYVCQHEDLTKEPATPQSWERRSDEAEL